jgi:hypothetical protein
MSRVRALVLCARKSNGLSIILWLVMNSSLLYTFPSPNITLSVLTLHLLKLLRA